MNNRNNCIAYSEQTNFPHYVSKTYSHLDGDGIVRVCKNHILEI